MRPIDVDELVRDIDELSKDAGFYRPIYEGFKNCVNSKQTIDAVTVVRCRERKHMIPQSHTRYCTVWNAVNGMGDDGFCNYGERKEGAD